MAQAAHHRFTFLDYLQIEEDSGVKHEFAAGQVYAMSDGSPAHARIAMTIGGMLQLAVRGRPCAVFSSDLRVRVGATGMTTYPDATVVCGPLELDPADPKGHTVLNPVILVEVLSPSTEDYDRGEKLGHYKQIPSLAEVVLVAHDRPEIEVVRREPDGSWSRQIGGAGETVRLRAVDADLPVDAIYRDPLLGR